MYSDHNQYGAQGYSMPSYPPYPPGGYATDHSSFTHYPAYDQSQASYGTGAIQPGPPGEVYPQTNWTTGAGYSTVPSGHHQQQPPPGQTGSTTQKDDFYKSEAVAQELKQQKANMQKQREEYVRKISVLRRELELLRNQKQDLVAAGSNSDRDNNHILKENNKLQVAIQNKMKSIHNVIDMLTDIIGDKKAVLELEESMQEEIASAHSPKSTQKPKSGNAESVEKSDSAYCYVFYDPELHWCRVCDVFPKTAKEYLLHLHSTEHRQVTQERDMVDTPWHRQPPEPEMPSNEIAPKRRIPIKGLQFLISSTAWYCKLCDTWVGDLHCASQHLKSKNHNQNYTNFVEQNSHWESEWLRDRDKTLTRVKTTKKAKSDSDDESPKKKRNDSGREKQKRSKKRREDDSSDDSSSSSSSSSDDSSSADERNDKSKSIRVAMRNKMKLQAQMIMKEDIGGKWEVLGRLVEEKKKLEALEMDKQRQPDDPLINQWMTISEPPDKEKRMMDSLKDRMRQKQEQEKIRQAELEQRQREKEKQEEYAREQKEKEEREKRQREEEKRREMEDLERKRERERDAIKFKTRESSGTARYRKRPPSPANSPQQGKSRSRYSPSPYPDQKRDKHHHYSENGRYNDHRSPPERKPSLSSRNGKEKDEQQPVAAKKPAGGKKPAFIGRMPLFKNKKPEEKNEKEIKKEEYDIPRQSRFQPGNLARSFLPEPEVVCFPKLSTMPPMPPPTPVFAPDPPQISKGRAPKAPPPPVIKAKQTPIAQVPLPPEPEIEQPATAVHEMDYQNASELSYPESGGENMAAYQYGGMDYGNMIYPHPPMYDYTENLQNHTAPPPPPPAIEYGPPPPPASHNDDLAMLGISVDDMAAQMF